MHDAGEGESSAGGRRESSGGLEELAEVPDTASGLHINLWQRRWGRRSDVPFHQYCDIVPRRQTPDRAAEEAEPWVNYTQGFSRQVLRYTPTFIIAALLVLVASSILSAETLAIGPPILGTKSAVVLLTLALGGLWLVVLVRQLRKVELLPKSDLLRVPLIYGTMLVLLADVVYLSLQVTIAIQEGTLAQVSPATHSFIPGAGSLLILFVGGHLVYDGMLRTETMFSKLHEKSPPVIGPPEPGVFDTAAEKATAFEQARHAYRTTFLAGFKALLEHRTTIGRADWLPFESGWSVRTAHLFGIVFVIPFFLIRLPDVPLAVVLSLLSVVETVVFFQFLLLVKYFNRLLTDHSPYEDTRGDGFTLQYQPDHPDGYAGFRDLGRFATRVNTILFFGGIYTAYWIYAGGLPNLPLDGGVAMTPEFLVWAFHYLSLLLIYVFTVVVWLYASFWQIHKAMRTGRERRIEMAMPDDPDGDLPPDKRDLKQAPVWPINTRSLSGILIGDMIPLLSLLPLFSM